MKKVLLHLILLLIIFTTISCNSHYIKIPIQNDKNDALYGETLYPEQIKAQLDIYNKKYNLDIKYANDKDEFNNFLKTLKLTNKPQAIFQYNEGHKYGFIFVKYNNQDYCVAIDTIPTLSEYTKNLKVKKNNNLYINFNDKEYRVVMFGENLQKAQKGCGSFTLVFLKHLLKNNAKILFDIIKLEDKYGNGDKTQRDKNKKSCIRGVNFEIIKNQDFAPEIYKYAQSMELQKNFDDRTFKKNEITFSNYRNNFSLVKQNKEGKNTQISTKIFDITQKYKIAPIIKKEKNKKENQKYSWGIKWNKNQVVNTYIPEVVVFEVNKNKAPIIIPSR